MALGGVGGWVYRGQGMCNKEPLTHKEISSQPCCQALCVGKKMGPHGPGVASLSGLIREFPVRGLQCHPNSEMKGSF